MTEKMDILNRQPFVDRLIDIVRLLADNHRGCTFAIDGTWGCGKTFILEMFEKQISLFQNPAAAGDRYALFHYNCWQYDYYEEPAIAICASIREQANRAIQLFPAATPKLQMLFELGKNIGKDLLCNYIETKFGVNANTIADARSILKDAEINSKDIQKEQHAYDTYFEFRQVLEKTRKDLSKLSEDKPIIIVVDELDRCLPEYAIMVLERLHHLFDQQKNIIVILAIDKARLSDTIRKVYGIDGKDVSNYLQKYIAFSIQLNTGTLSGMFWDKYADYLSCFVPPDEQQLNELNTMVTTMFDGIDVRSQEKIMENCLSLHILNFSEKCPLSILLFEMIHQVVLFKTNSISSLNVLSQLSQAHHTTFERDIGEQQYAYLKNLEKQSHADELHIMGKQSTFWQLKNNLYGQFIWWTVSSMNSVEGAICGHYAHTEAKNLSIYAEKTKAFHQLACLIQ